MLPPRYTPLSVTSRYLIREFIGMLVPIVLAFVIVYLLVDFFDRLNVLLKHHATFGSALRYFLFKIPLIVTQIMPAAVLAAILLSLGILSRRSEIIALRASGISLASTAVPLLAVAATISAAILAWNEAVVPYCTQQYEDVNNLEIRKRPQRSILSDHEIWYHGRDGFYNIEHVDVRRQTLVDLTIYRTDPAFNLLSTIEMASAHWTGTGWVTSGAIERSIDSTGEIVTRPLPPEYPVMHESLSDFLQVHRKPEELSYLALRRRIRELSRKGIDTSNYLVDLHLKLALPFMPLVFACVAIPLAGRVQRHPSVATIIGTGLVVGFAYWVVLGLTGALGESGVLPPVVSAWAANLIFLALGLALFLSAD
jgi:lipopolysaccharide export system permease protein